MNWQLYTKFVKHTFESKPQLNNIFIILITNYTQNSSNTLLKANHNKSPPLVLNPVIIHKIRQTHFWKQTTTQDIDGAPTAKLYTKFVKHTFESKPQLHVGGCDSIKYYTQNSSNTLLKANHNLLYASTGSAFIIHKIRQTHFWKQTTTLGLEKKQFADYTQNSSNTLLKANHNMVW